MFQYHSLFNLFYKESNMDELTKVLTRDKFGLVKISEPSDMPSEVLGYISIGNGYYLNIDKHRGSSPMDGLVPTNIDDGHSVLYYGIIVINNTENRNARCLLNYHDYTYVVMSNNLELLNAYIIERTCIFNDYTDRVGEPNYVLLNGFRTTDALQRMPVFKANPVVPDARKDGQLYFVMIDRSTELDLLTQPYLPGTGFVIDNHREMDDDTDIVLLPNTQVVRPII